MTNLKKVSMKDIAERLNISKNAVSLALNGKPGVSESTRDQVLDLARKLNYAGFTTDDSAYNCRNILVFIPEYIKDDSFFYNDIYWSIDNYSKSHGYNSVMATISSQMQENMSLPSILTQLNIAGFVLVGIFNENYVKFILKQNIKTISVDHYYSNLNMDCIVTANLEGAYTLTKKVIEMGHTKIGFVGSINVTSSIFERWCGYQKALIYSDIKINYEYSITKTSPLGILLHDPDELYDELKRLNELPTAFVCGGDRIAIALLEALKKLGISVPEDISIVGFDDIALSSFVSPKLTTMQVKRKELSKVAVNHLLNKSDIDDENVKLSIYPEYIERESLIKAKGL